MPLTVLSTDEIREILVKRVDRQMQAVGIVVGVIEPDGRRVVAWGDLAKGKLANADPRTFAGDGVPGWSSAMRTAP
jgi:D-alanyl-D-alanine-carboxypeptidase/D-alanyl-D-alanine-endopeptidase